MILPVRRGGLDRQQRKYPVAQRKKITRKEEKTQRLRPLCGFASRRLCVNKKEYLPAMLRDRQQRREDAKIKTPLRLCAFA